MAAQVKGRQAGVPEFSSVENLAIAKAAINASSQGTKTSAQLRALTGKAYEITLTEVVAVYNWPSVVKPGAAGGGEL